MTVKIALGLLSVAPASAQIELYHRLPTSPAHRDGDRFVLATLTELSGIREGSALSLPIPGRAPIRGIVDFVETGFEGGRVLIGHRQDGQAYERFFISTSGEAVAGSVSLDGREFMIAGRFDDFKVALRSNSNWPEDNPALDDGAFSPRRLVAEREQPVNPPSVLGLAQIDMVVVINPDFVNANTGNGGPTARINFLVSKANQAFRDSGISIALRVVHVATHAAATATTNPDALDLITPATSTNPAVSSVFANLRASKQADLVIYLRKFAINQRNCGHGWIGGSRDAANEPLRDLADLADFGYSVVSDGADGDIFCSDLTLAHEVGHNLGSMHDRTTENSFRRGAFEESFGHWAQAGTRTFHTIMGYPAPTNPVQAAVFSSPVIANFCGGIPCGIGSGANSADNARRISDVRFKVASWFGHKYNLLEVETAGTGEGTIAGNGLSCSLACTAGFQASSVITLTARPEEGSSFLGWSGDCTGTGSCSVGMNAAHRVVANFTSAAPKHTLRVLRSGSGRGSVSGLNLACGATCVVRYPVGTMLAIRAVPDPGFSFAGWDGACAEQPANCRVTMNQPLTVTARFGGTRTTMISAGGATTYAVKEDGSLWAWGNNDLGQFGVGHTSSSAVPVLVGTGFSMVEAGWTYAFGIKRDGSLWAWGDNSKGQLGDGTRTNRLTPVRIGDGFQSVSAGAFHAIGLKAGGTLWAWGWNMRGQIGNGTQTDQLRPIQIGNGYIHATADGSTSMAVKQNGTLWVWGLNEFGQLGDGTTVNRTSPVQIGTDFKLIFAGGDRAFAIKRNGDLWGWGTNSNAELGDGTTYYRMRPVYIDGGNYVHVVANGANSSAAIKADGTLWTWGVNYGGELGDGTEYPKYQERPQQIGSGFRLLAGRRAFHATTLDGSLWGWGSNGNGELGDGSTDSRFAPILIMPAN